MPPTLLKRLSRFALVGVIGFVIDAGLTTYLVVIGLDPFSGRIIALCLAMFTTWRLNRSLTFGKSHTSQAHEGLRYGLIAVTAAAINYAAYAALIIVVSGIWPPIAVAAATGVSMIFSYIGYSRFAFRAA